MNAVTKIVSNALFLQVRDQLVDVLVVGRLEGTTGGEIDVPGDLVDTDTARDVAAFVRLILQLVCPTFFHTLVCPFQLGVPRGYIREDAPT